MHEYLFAEGKCYNKRPLNGGAEVAEVANGRPKVGRWKRLPGVFRKFNNLYDLFERKGWERVDILMAEIPW